MICRFSPSAGCTPTEAPEIRFLISPLANPGRSIQNSVPAPIWSLIGSLDAEHDIDMREIIGEPVCPGPGRRWRRDNGPWRPGLDPRRARRPRSRRPSRSAIPLSRASRPGPAPPAVSPRTIRRRRDRRRRACGSCSGPACRLPVCWLAVCWLAGRFPGRRFPTRLAPPASVMDVSPPRPTSAAYRNSARRASSARRPARTAMPRPRYERRRCRDTPSAARSARQ